MQDTPRSTQALLALVGQGVTGPALDVGSHDGAVAVRVGCTYANVDLVACQRADQAGAGTVLHTDLLPDGPFVTLFFDAREYDPGFAAETVAQAAARLAPGGVFITTARLMDVQACFASVEEHGEALIARAPVPSPPSPEWPTYEVTVGEHTHRVQSAPGVFSPRQLDLGTALMLEQIGTPPPGARFLDLGCGAGIVSRIAAEAWGCRATAVDVNARALRLTALNAPAAEVVASNGFAALAGRQFDLIASNPPYHTDFGVAKAFIEGAHVHLELGGSLYLVVKRADWYVQKVRTTFGGCRVVEQNGYTVIVAEKRPPRPKAAQAAEPPTTRKHAKRMAGASHKKRR
ncbi:MAG TPA: methyltransferase [Symbiobacteriaceae bacterium]|nr:methyltransferase [Symbiobacteriaceae bacterium]